MSTILPIYYQIRETIKGRIINEEFKPGEKIREQDLYKKPLPQIIEQDTGIQFTEAFQTIEASFANQESPNN